MKLSLIVERNAAGRFDYVITTASGFRAVLERCDRDGCAPGGYLVECRRKLNHRGQHETGGRNSVDAWLRHAKTHCHSWHDGRIDDLIAAVLRTYGKGQRAHRATLPTRGGHGPMRVEQIAEALDLTVDEYRARLALAGTSC